MWVLTDGHLFRITPEVSKATEASQEETPPSIEAATTDQTTAPDLLPGVDLVTEEVEPGVFRIVDDGRGDLSRPVVGEGYEASSYQSNLTAGHDGSVWIFGPERFFRGPLS